MKWRVCAWYGAILLALAVTASCSVEGSRGPTPPFGAKGGPPPHAPAHGQRRKQLYRYSYYPSAYVYFDVERKLYFYLEAGAWKVGAKLPAAIRIDAGEAVSLSLETDQPYLEFEAHKAKHPPGRSREPGRTGEGVGKGRGAGRAK